MLVEPSNDMHDLKPFSESSRQRDRTAQDGW
jgi:hypothetical protein